MNKLSLLGLALCAVSPAFAQSSVTTTFTTPQTLTVGNCTATITTLTQNPANNTISVDATSCGGTAPTPNVTLAISSPSYTVNSGAAAPTVTWTPNAAAAGATCQLTQSSPAGITASADPTSANRFLLSTPQTAGTYTFTPTCTLAGAAITPTPTYVTLTVSNQVITPPPPGCDAMTYTANVNGKTVQRQCSGSMVVYPGGTGYSGNLTDLGTVLGGSAWPLYKYAGGYSPTFAINANQYIALAFTPTSSGTLHFAVNLSYGDGGIISVSTQPGSLLAGSPGLVCSFSRNGSNSPYIGTSGSNCPVVVGRTYYLNMADMDASGNNLCNGAMNTCSVGNVSYALYTSQ